jgi:hypothetical protein
MGGPSRESYRAAEAARKKRLDAMRTRDGIVDLEEFRVAQRTALWLEQLVGSSPSFLSARLVPAPTAGFELRLTLVRDDPDLRLCLPSSVDDVPVRVIARNAGRPSASVSAHSVRCEP